MTSGQTLAQIGALVRTTRRDAGMTQAELATRAGVSRYTVIRLESGKLADLNFKTLASILGVLDLQLQVTSEPVSGLPVLGEP